VIYWYFRDPNRFAAEQGALHDLEREASWLTITHTRLDDGLRVCVDAEIAARGATFAATLRYPQTFPHSPPSVLPQSSGWLSSHQYGAGGELCLEYGPDNWRPELTGAEMVRSARRLLEGEAAGPDDRPVEVASRHQTTAGQALRTQWGRLLVTQALAQKFAEEPAGLTTRARFLTLNRDEAYVVIPASLGGSDGKGWIDSEAPQDLPTAVTWEGLAFRLPPGVVLRKFSVASELKGWLTDHGYAPPADYASAAIELVLLWSDAGARLIWFRGDNDGVFDFTVVEAAGGQRLDVEYAGLAGKTVGLVGCGSAGAKIAVSLARAGVRGFVLIDDDFLLPENLVRQELDWTAMAEHKVDGLKRRLSLVAPGARCAVRRHRLGGQEASSGADWSLTRLQECDLIIDATANPAVFNLLSSVAQAAEKPLVWLEIFAGGIGGLIARSRPGRDPSPQTVRAHIDGWCADQGVAPPRPLPGYGADTTAGTLVADDADVAVIAAHASRYCLDILIGRSPSAYPNSAYLIGLSEAWLFTQPFHTIPLDVGGADPKAETSPVDPAAVEAIIHLFQDRRDQASAAS
jgi:hypothetical protein